MVSNSQIWGDQVYDFTSIDRHIMVTDNCKRLPIKNRAGKETCSVKNLNKHQPTLHHGQSKDIEMHRNDIEMHRFKPGALNVIRKAPECII